MMAYLIIMISERPAGVSTKEIVINAYATPTGQVLVPLNVYQKYFHNPQSLPSKTFQNLGDF
jgi:hypothetical protein